MFACLDAGAAPLDAWLGTFGDVVAPYPIETYRFHRRDVHRLQANWKTYADNYLEGYHIPLVHPTLHRVVESSRYTVTAHDGGRWNRHHVPAADGAPTTGAWVFLYPNLALNVYPSGINVERIVPRGPQLTDVVFEPAPRGRPLVVPTPRARGGGLSGSRARAGPAPVRAARRGRSRRGPGPGTRRARVRGAG